LERISIYFSNFFHSIVSNSIFLFRAYIVLRRRVFYYWRDMMVWEIWSILVSSIAMVVLGHFSSLSNGGVDLLGISLGGINLTWPGAAQIPSRREWL
jgi:hypothetical protein